MDKHDKPLSMLTRMDAVDALRQCRAELLDAKQRIKDLEGEVQALIECEKYQPKNDVSKMGRTRR